MMIRCCKRHTTSTVSTGPWAISWSTGTGYWCGQEGRHSSRHGGLDRYRRESEPITEDGPDVLPLEQLAAAIESSQSLIDTFLGELSDEAFSAETENDGRMVSLAQQLHFDYFHDTYHTGQTEILRQVAGVNDQII